MGIYATAGDFGVRLTEKGDNCLLLEFQRWLDEWKVKRLFYVSSPYIFFPDKISSTRRFNRFGDATDFESLLALPLP